MIMCSCRGITDTQLQEAFDRIRENAPDRQVSAEDGIPDFGDYECGGCRRLFEKAAQNYNETGSVRSSRQKSVDNPESGLCSYAQTQVYSTDGIPDLRNPAFVGVGNS